MYTSRFRTLLVIFVILPSHEFNDSDKKETDCFTADVTECSSLTSCKCKLISAKNSVFCCNINSTEELKSNLECAGSTQYAALHILHSNIARLDANAFKLRNLISLSITGNNITELFGQFNTPQLRCLNLSSNSLQEIDPNILPQNNEVSMLSIARNNMTFLHPILFKTKFDRIDLSGNPQLHCKNLIEIIHEILPEKISSESGIFVNRNETTCAPPKSQSGWLVNDGVLLPLDVIEDTKQIDKECPKINGIPCECSVHSLETDVNKKYLYQAKVDCSNRNLVFLPAVLPKNTKILNISCNNITSLEGIGSPLYSSIKELYADNNKISSMKPLEGSDFLHGFNILSLKSNKLNKLETYLLSNVFDRKEGKKLFLGNNHMSCDCDTVREILLLSAYKGQVPDHDELWCHNYAGTKVINLQRDEVCLTKPQWKDFIQYIIVLEVVLFLLLIAKVSYDYYVFKSAGYLPWPASKMPKLPCDWCFET